MASRDAPSDSDSQLKELHLPGGKTTAAATAKPETQAKKPLIVEMKDRPQIEEDTKEAGILSLTIHVDKETSAKGIDLDVSESELKLESEQ